MSNVLRKAQLSLVDKQDTRFTQVSTFYDERYQLMWCYMHATPCPCFTPALLDELLRFRDDLVTEIDSGHGRDIRYMVLASEVPGVFNLGGQLDLFRGLIESKDREGLHRYARTCIDVLYANLTNFNRNVTTLSLVQGDALGGGFEGALSSDVLVAERSARMGLPEILFNLFPGMGAYSLLSRKLDSVRAERLILSGRICTAEELYEMGVVDVLAEDLQGETAVYDYIKKENRAANGYRALRAAKNRTNPITYQELTDVAEIWVDAALRLEGRDLRMMERLIARQGGKGREAA